MGPAWGYIKDVTNAYKIHSISVGIRNRVILISLEYRNSEHIESSMGPTWGCIEDNQFRRLIKNPKFV